MKADAKTKMSPSCGMAAGLPGRLPGKVRAAAMCLSFLLLLLGGESALAGVRATVHTGKGVRDLILLGVAGNQLRYSFADGGAESAMPVTAIERVHILIEYDRSALAKAAGAGQYGTAAAILVKPILPLLPFLSLPSNNQTPTAMEALVLLMRAAGERQLIGDQNARDEAGRQYKLAAALAKAISQAEWFHGAEEAAYRGAFCLTAVGETEKAVSLMEELGVPAETDASFGWYALTRASLLMLKEDYAAALEGGIESVVFEARDVDSFPAALALTGVCYEKLGEWHRARDVHMALARLFRESSWEVYGIGRLKHILDKGLTQAEEAQAVHQVFFSGREDLNKEASELIETYSKRKTEGTASNEK